MKRTVSCRIEDCDVSETFDTVDSINDSGWDEVSPFSVNGNLIGYCPDHST